MEARRTTGLERALEFAVLVGAVTVLAFALLELRIPPAGAEAAMVAATGPLTVDHGEEWSISVTSPTDVARRLLPIQASNQPVATRTVNIDLDRRHQTWLGTGAALTDVSVDLLDADRPGFDLLFDPSRADGASLNLLRLPLSATDFSSSTWTWDWDEQTGRATPTAATHRAVRLIDDIVAVRPDAQVVAAPWTAPADMMTSGGALAPASVRSYGDLLSAQVGWLVDRAVPVKAVSMINEPGYAADYPSMTMSDEQMIDVARATAAELDRRGVELWAVDHNWNDRARVDNVTAGAPGAFDAAAFHCYGGSPSDMVGVQVPVVVTECTGTTDSWISTFGWDSRVLVAESIRSGSTGLLMWNLALPPAAATLPGGCGDCRGLLTIDPTTGTVTRNPEFFVLAHLAAAADPGAVSVDTSEIDGLPTVAFANPDGTVGLFGHNDTDQTQVIEIARSDGIATTIAVGPWELFSARR
jgi:glucosylceramidase